MYTNILEFDLVRKNLGYRLRLSWNFPALFPTKTIKTINPDEKFKQR